LNGLHVLEFCLDNYKGPPDSVTQLSCTDVAADSVELHWKAGFDYGSSQTFQVQGSVNNKALQSKWCDLIIWLICNDHKFIPYAVFLIVD
jgi:hypothetical protein